MILHKTLIVLPAYNVGSVIGNVIAMLPISKTVVVDDGSIDETYDIVNNLGYMVIRHPTNLGLAAAIRTGEHYATQHGYTHVLLMDADGQHPPEFFGKFCSALDSSDFVVGDRFSSLRDIPPQKIASNLFASLLVKEVTGLFIRDVSCGYRGYKLGASSVTNELNGYSTIYAQVVQSALAGIIPARIAIPAIYDGSSPLATKCTEIHGLCNALSYYSPKQSLLAAILNYVRMKADIDMQVAGVPFTAHYVEMLASYIFSTDNTIAAKLYGN